jgi:hypothetical protein
MATPAEIRARLRAAGRDVPARGRISGDMMADYEAVTAGDPPALPPEHPEAPEVAPRVGRERKAPGKGLAERIRPGGRSRAGAKGRGKAKPKHERVSLSRLIEGGWGVLARLTHPLSEPLSRCLEMQSPVAGMVLEDAVKGTFVDSALQPFARAEKRAKAMAALVIPPMCVAAAEAAQGLPDEQRAIRLAIIEPILLESLTWWAEVAGDKLEERMERERELGPARDLAIRMFQQIFGMPPEPPAAPPAGPAAERTAEEQAQAVMAVQAFAAQ